jgi:toxin CcdB
MAQYQIYENLNPDSKKNYPYLLDVQASILSDLDTRTVVPLVNKEKIGKGIIKNLNPTVIIHKKEYILITQQMAGIPSTQIGSPVCDCVSKRQEILSAVDFLITGI